MNIPASQASRIAAGRPRGFTLVELMIAITVSVFLIGGLLWMVQSTRNTFAAQNQLAQLQDNERLVMTFMTEVIESTGYFPNPQLYTNAAVLPIAGVFAAPGQAVFGTYNAAAPGDSVTIRYGAAFNDNNLFNCRGTTNTALNPYDTFVNTFWVNNANPNNPILTCTFSSGATPLPGVPVPLVNGVTNLSILYGIKRNAADTGSCADTYLNASQMLAADWSAVCSVVVTVSFINPLYNPNGPIGPQNPQTINLTRVVAVMNAAGVNS
jgi:type IV pilus assembly protein PilW